MIRHSETRSLKYSSDQMFNLVADIKSYPDFIPWCTAVSVISSIENKNDGYNVLVANMNVSFKFFKESFSSKVTFYPLLRQINVEYVNGPFKFLTNTWCFTDSNNGCIVDFNVEFEFRSKIMQRLIGVVFQEAMRRIVKSFEQRADIIYK